MDSTQEAGSGTAPKHARLDCIIHCSSSDEELVSPKDINSWKTLLRAAEIRQHAPILDLAKGLPDDAIPAVAYHQKCRSIFTMKRDLDAIISKQRRTEENKSSTERKKSQRPAPSQSRVYEAECIFCEKTSKYLKGDRTRDPLVQCTELRADEKVRKAAVSKLDNRMFAIVSRDLVAAEGHYHRTCYREYTRDSSTTTQDSGKGASAAPTDTDAEYEAAEQQSYNDLFSYVREELFVNPDVVPMTNLTARLVEGMVTLGVETVKASTKKHIQRKLVAEFGEALQITQDDNGNYLCIPTAFLCQSLLRHTKYSRERCNSWNQTGVRTSSTRQHCR
ncbi:uncharacterized protein KZ484_018411 isoform 1-T2 [Pholidichthys leucotaenia]